MGKDQGFLQERRRKRFIVMCMMKRPTSGWGLTPVLLASIEVPRLLSRGVRPLSARHVSQLNSLPKDGDKT